MSTEWGVFGPEGLLEQDLWSHEQALYSLQEYEAMGEEHLYVAEVCGSCRGGEYGECECDE